LPLQNAQAGRRPNLGDRLSEADTKDNLAGNSERDATSCRKCGGCRARRRAATQLDFVTAALRSIWCGRLLRRR